MSDDEPPILGYVTPGSTPPGRPPLWYRALAALAQGVNLVAVTLLLAVLLLAVAIAVATLTGR